MATQPTTATLYFSGEEYIVPSTITAAQFVQHLKEVGILAMEVDYQLTGLTQTNIGDSDSCVGYKDLAVARRVAAE